MIDFLIPPQAQAGTIGGQTVLDVVCIDNGNDTARLELRTTNAFRVSLSIVRDVPHVEIMSALDDMIAEAGKTLDRIQRSRKLLY